MMDEKEQSAIDALRAAGLEAEASAVEALRARHSRLINDFLAGQRDSYRNGQVAERERWAHVFDGWRVLQALTPEQRKRIGYAAVSDVLDAVARLSRPYTGMTGPSGSGR
jgi:DNA polymerase III delta subunit